MQHQQKTQSNYQRQVEALAEAVRQQQVAAQAVSQWERVLGKTGDKYARRYFEGQLELSKLRAAHHNLVAQSCQRAGHERAYCDTETGEGSRTQTGVRQVIRAKSSLEMTLAAKGREKAVIEQNAHRAKAAAFSMLGDRCRELGMGNDARTYEARARLEEANIRGFEGVVRGYDRKLEDMGLRMSDREQPASLESSLHRLESAERHLEDYNRAHAAAMAAVRHVRELEETIQRLESESAERSKIEEVLYQRDVVAALAEKEALAAAQSYMSSQEEVYSARKAYDSLSLAMTGKPLDNLKPHSYQDDLEKIERRETLHETEGNLEGPGRVVTERRISDNSVREPERDQPKADTGESDSHRRTVPEQGQHRVAVGVVVGQILQELDREM
jgi:hypothetical protein